MGRFLVVIVSYVVFGFSSCAPLKFDPVTSLLKKSCPSVKNLEKILPDACREDNVPPECEIMIDYILRLCKRGDFSFDSKVNKNWTCPLPLPDLEVEEFKKDSKTSIMMQRLVNNATCLTECAGNGEILCSRLNDLAMLIKRNPSSVTIDSQRNETKPEVLKPTPKPTHQPEMPKPVPKVVPPIKTVPEYIETVAPPALPPRKEDVPATSAPAPVPTEAAAEEENPAPEKPEVKPEPDVDMDLDGGDPNMGGPPRPDDYAEDVMETESKTGKPAVVNEVTEGRRPIQSGPYQEAPDSHFFAYFLFLTCISVIGYIAFHNKNKLLALALEGRRGRQGRRRPNSASYRKLDSSLEEAIMSNPSRASNSPVIF